MKNLKKNKNEKKVNEQTQKNPYLRKNGGNLTRVTQPRISMAIEANATSDQALPRVVKIETGPELAISKTERRF